MNNCNPRLHTQMECDTKIQNLITDLQRRTKIRVKDAPSLSHQPAKLSLRCLKYFYPCRGAGPVIKCSVALAARISKRHMQRFARSTRPGPQSQGQGWGQNLKSPCRSCGFPEKRICTSTWLLSPRFAKERAQSATGEVCWPLSKGTGLLWVWVCSERRGSSSLSLGV